MPTDIHGESAEIEKRLTKIEGALESIAGNLQRMKSAVKAPVWIPVDSFAPEPYAVVEPFTIVLSSEDDEVLASWFDANLHAAGETEEQAFNDLKAMVLDTFDRLDQLSDDEMGPGPRRQKRVLRSHISRITT